MTPASSRKIKGGGEGGGPQFRTAMRKLGPTEAGTDGGEFGGQGARREEYIFASESARGLSLPTLTLETVAPR